MTFGIAPFILEDISAVIRRFPAVERAVIFGSRARGDYRNTSDIDIGIIGPELSQADFARLHLELQSLPIVYKMDIVHGTTGTNPALADKIAAEGVVFYTRDTTSSPAQTS